MKKDFFIDKIKNNFNIKGNSLYSFNTDKVLSYLNNQDYDNVMPINLGTIEKGKFYFMYFNLDGKTSKMEKINVLFALDWIDADNTRYLYAISINFIPVAIRTVYFNMLCNSNLKVFKDIETTSILSQLSFNGIGLNEGYTSLKSIGFEWAIRKFDIKYINKVYQINLNILDEFITMSTAKITGVDDGKLIDIWRSKLDKQEERHKKFIADLIGDYNKMSKELENNLLDVKDKEENLLDVLNSLKRSSL